MISMSDCEISQHYKNICKPNWEEKGFVVNNFEAATPSKNPDILNSQAIKFEKKIKMDGQIYEFTETEKAVWYSHLFLWMKSWHSNTPIIVAEHDVKPLEDISIEEGVGFAYLCHSPENKTLLPCGAYYMSPKLAEYLSERAMEGYKHMYLNVDGFIVNEINNLIELWADDFLAETPAEEIEQVYERMSKDAVTCKDFCLGYSFGKFKLLDKSCQSMFDEKIGKTIEHNVKRLGKLNLDKIRRRDNDMVKKTLS